MKWELFFITVILFFMSLSTRGQSGDVRFHNINIEDGLSHSFVSTVAEDSMGFLWLGTQDGLNRYDGYDFKSYFQGEGDRSPSDSWIEKIYIDRFNQLWIYYVPGGIDRFDPFTETFHSYRHDSTVAGSISSHFLYTETQGQHTHFLEDLSGTLWIATEKGLNMYNRAEDRFERVGENLPDGSGLSSMPVVTLEEDLEHQILIATESGLHRYDPESGEFGRFNLSPEEENMLGELNVNHLYAGPDSSIWVGTELGGLVIIDDAYGDHCSISRLIEKPIDPEQVPTINIIHRTASGEMLVGTQQGLYQVTQENDSYEAQIYGETRELPILHIMDDEKGYVWIASDHQVAVSLFRLEPGLKSMEVFTFDERNPFSFVGGMVLFLHQSRTGLIWISTEHQGFHKVDPNAKKFRTINSNSSRELYISNKEVYSIYEDPQKRLYVGTKTELNRIDLEEGTFRNYGNEYALRKDITFSYSNQFPADLVGVIKDAGDGRLWLGTFDYKVGLYDPARESFLHFHHNEDDEHSFLGWSTRSICVTKSGETYIGATRNGLCKLNEDGLSFFYFPVVGSGDPSGTNDEHIQYIYEDSDSILWLGTLKGGLNRLDPATGDFHHFTHSHGDTASISGNTVRCILEPVVYGRGEILWVGTSSGLNKYSKQSRTFTTYALGEGPANTIHGILEDKYGRLWMSTNKGLVEFDPTTEQLRKYSSEDGLQGDEFNEGAFFKNDEGVMYFGGTDGITYFQPDEIEGNPQTAPVVITGLRLSGNPVFPNDTVNGRVVLRKSIQYSDRIQLTHQDRFVSFEFASPISPTPKKLVYRYMLEGFEDVWHELGFEQRTIRFTNLPHGEYRLLISASNNEGTWSEDPTILDIEVLPPFSQTIWFWLIIAILLLLIFISTIWIRTRMLQKQKGMLELEVEERTSDLRESNKLLEDQKNETQVMAEKLHESDQMKLKFFTNISHEFRTPLTLIMGPTEHLLNQDNFENGREVRQKLGLIYRNEKRLFKLINQLLEIRKVETGNLKLSVTEGDIFGFLEQIHQLFMPYAEQKSIDFLFQTESSELRIYFDADKIEKIFYNLLSNAFKYTPEYGKILFTAYIDGEGEQRRLKISVTDNGPGIAGDHLPHVFNRFYQVSSKYRSGMVSSGIGLSLSQDLVENHHGEIGVISEEGKGTTFEVFIPLDPDLYRDEEIVTTKAQGPSKSYLNDMIETFDQSEEEAQDEPSESEELFLILVVEDNLEMQKFLYDELSGRYSVMLAKNGAEGLDMAQERLPDLILSDVMMPEMDGMELCKRIKNNELTSHVPVILLTAKSGTESQLTGLEFGADDYITKPFHTEVLKLKIGNILSGRKQLVERFSKDSNYIPENIKISQIDQGFLEKFVQLVEDNIDNTELSGDMLACELGMSKGNLYKKLKSVSGMTVNIFIRTIRLKLAARLLERGTYNISEVAYAVGFNNPKYFSTCFSELYSMSPKEYMK